MTAGLPLMKNVLTPLDKNVSLPFELSAADAAIQKTKTNKKDLHGSGHPLDLASRTAALIILNEEMEDIMKIVNSLEDSRVPVK